MLYLFDVTATHAGLTFSIPSLLDVYSPNLAGPGSVGRVGKTAQNGLRKAGFVFLLMNGIQIRNWIGPET
jgi:hypothetical protein